MAEELAIIKPWEIDDPVIGHKVAIRVSENYSTLHINERVYDFKRETGEFDGLSRPMGEGAELKPVKSHSLVPRPKQSLSKP